MSFPRFIGAPTVMQAFPRWPPDTQSIFSGKRRRAIPFCYQPQLDGFTCATITGSKSPTLTCRLVKAARRLEHDAEKCKRFSAEIMLYFFFDSRADSDFRSIRPKIIRL
jgi:hypothetical protein